MKLKYILMVLFSAWVLTACKEEEVIPEPPKVPELKTVDYWLADRENMMHFRKQNCGINVPVHPDDCQVIDRIIYDRKNDGYSRARDKYESILRIRAKNAAS